MARALPLIAALIALCLPATASAVSVKDRYIVVLKDGADSSAVAKEHGRKYGVQDRLVYGHAIEGYAGKVPPGQLAKIKSDPRVAYVEPDGVAHATVTQTGATWGLDRIDQRALPLSGTYTYTQTGAGVKAYVIDTGVRLTHTEFGGRATSGWDFVDGDSNATDCDGHGTHVAGTIGGATYGVAKGVNLVAVRVLDCNGSGTWSGVIKGIDWVTQNHQAGQPAVANMSLGGGAAQAVDDAVTASIADGVTYSISAGNSNANACNYSPARTPNALTIGATASNDARASFSNWGSCVDWFAPGVSITSSYGTSDTATAVLSGTSMSSPHNSGAAALYLQGNPTATPAAVRSALASNLTLGVVTSSNTAANHLLYVGPADGGSPPPTFSLTTRGYKVRGIRRVDLTWNGAGTSTVDVFRNNVRILTGTANDGFQTDNVGGKGAGSFTYKVCNAGSTTACSNNSTVNF